MRLELSLCCIYEVILAVRRVLFILRYVHRRNPPRKADKEVFAALGHRKFDTKSNAGNYADKALKIWAGNICYQSRRLPSICCKCDGWVAATEKSDYVQAIGLSSAKFQQH